LRTGFARRRQRILQRYLTRPVWLRSAAAHREGPGVVKWRVAIIDRSTSAASGVRA
jgi:hypothetical protein